MLKEYKKKFILSNMILVGIVIFTMLCAIFVYSYDSNIKSLKNTLLQTLSPVSSHSLDDSESSEADLDSETNDVQEIKEPPKNDTQERKEPPEVNDMQERKEPPEVNDTQEHKEPPDKHKSNNNVSVVFYRASEDKMSVLSESVIADTDTLKSAVKEISNMDSGFGKLSKYGVYYYIQHTANEDKIAMAATSYIISKMLELFCILVLVFVVTMFLFFAISRHLAILSIKPLEASILREKQFVADASHDLKTPVAVILANIGIIKNKKYNGEAEMNKWLDSTLEAAKNIRHLVEEMLELSQVEYREKSILKENINMSDIAEKSALFMESAAYEKGIEYDYDIAEDLYVNSNGEYADKIFSTLIENAVKYEESGSKIIIKLYEKSNKVVFSINNKNALIAAQDLPHIFDRFYRSDKSRHNNSSHGLGLAIVKKTADAIGAQVAVQSIEGEGTTFTVIFSK